MKNIHISAYSDVKDDVLVLRISQNSFTNKKNYNDQKKNIIQKLGYLITIICTSVSTKCLVLFPWDVDELIQKLFLEEVNLYSKLFICLTCAS